MIGADVTVAWVDKTSGKGYANDYYLDAKSQCSGKHGSCPDTRIKVKLYFANREETHFLTKLIMHIGKYQFDTSPERRYGQRLLDRDLSASDQGKR